MKRDNKLYLVVLSFCLLSRAYRNRILTSLHCSQLPKLFLTRSNNGNGDEALSLKFCVLNLKFVYYTSHLIKLGNYQKKRVFASQSLEILKIDF